MYEDDDLLAVSKPPFVSTAPRHRWEVSCDPLEMSLMHVGQYILILVLPLNKRKHAEGIEWV